MKTGDDYEYDANGDLTKDADGKRFTYDALNKQTEVKNSSNRSLGKYVYDGEGKRVKKLDSGHLANYRIRYVFDEHHRRGKIRLKRPSTSSNYSSMSIVVVAKCHFDLES